MKTYHKGKIMNNNITTSTPTETMTPEQALQSALQRAEHGGLQDCLVVAYDNDGDLFIRSSRMDRKTALWFAEKLRLYALQ